MAKALGGGNPRQKVRHPTAWQKRTNSLANESIKRHFKSYDLLRPKWPLTEHHSRFGLVQVPSSAVSSHVSPMANLSKVPTSLHKQLLQTKSLKIDHKLIHFPPSVLHQQQTKRPTASAKSAAFDKNRRESQTEGEETAPEGQPLLTNADANV